MKNENPLHLTPAELKTLALIQELARRDESVWAMDNVDGDQRVNLRFQPHNDVCYFGHLAVPAEEASIVLQNDVWLNLETKGLAKGHAQESATITQAGKTYPTGRNGFFISE